MLKGNMEERAERLALYIIENRTTVRAAAQKFGISKSTVHDQFAKQLAFGIRNQGLALGFPLRSHTGPFSKKNKKTARAVRHRMLRFIHLHHRPQRQHCQVF